MRERSPEQLMMAAWCESVGIDGQASVVEYARDVTPYRQHLWIGVHSPRIEEHFRRAPYCLGSRPYVVAVFATYDRGRLIDDDPHFSDVPF